MMSVAGVIRAFPRGEGRSSGAVRRLYRLLAAESLVVVLCAACVFFFSFSILSLLGNDSWMTIVWGREIAAHGIPYDDALTVMTHGKAWVDQQWLTQLVFWEIFRAGGIKLALLVTIALLVTPITVATVLARRRGASVTSILPFALLPLFNFSSILRAQLFSQLLFVLLLALLLAERRSRSRRAP